MKKMLFSAIVMIAFTLSANAANEVVESIDASTTSSSPCTNQWKLNMDIFQGKYPGSQMDLSFDEALVLAEQLFDICLDKTYGSGSNNKKIANDRKSVGLSK